MDKKKVNVTQFRYMCFLSIFFCAFTLFSINHRLLIVSGDSMVPTLYDNYIVVVTKVTMPEVGKVYVSIDPDEKKSVIKRLVGGPGDNVELVDGYTYCNGELLREATGDNWDTFKVTLGVDEYFFLGDNRAVSYDSRYWSRPLHQSEIKYELKTIIYPFSKIGKVR